MTSRHSFVLAASLAFAPLLTAQESAAPSTPHFASWTPRPPMGWNSYDAYHGAITEWQFRAVVDELASKFKPLGWDYAVVDYLWFHPGPDGWDPSPGKWKTFPLTQTRDASGRMSPRMVHDDWGRPVPALNRWPSAANGAGFKPLADYVHSKGMKFGLHLMRGIPAQVVDDNLPILGTPYHARDIAEDHDVSSFLRGMWHGIDHTKPGAQEYYDSVIALCASWGVDYLKVDDITGPVYHEKEIEMVRRAIDKTGRPMVLSLSYGEAHLSKAWHVRQNANLWRVSADFWDEWPSLRRNFDLLNAWSPFIGHGTWPDGDMLPIGRLCLTGYPNDTIEKHKEHESHFTEEAHYALMSLWCIARSPLMWGGDPLTSTAWSTSFLTNPEVIAVNQQGANPRQIHSRPLATKPNHRVWVSDIPGSPDKYFAMFNLTDEAAEVTFAFELEYLRGTYTIRDLWQRRDLGTHAGSFTTRIGAHGGRLYRLTPVP